MNKEILLLWVILCIMCVSCAVGSGVWMTVRPYKSTLYIPYAEGDPEPALFGFLSFWSNIILFNVMVPISLYVTLELIKLGQVCTGMGVSLVPGLQWCLASLQIRDS